MSKITFAAWSLFCLLVGSVMTTQVNDGLKLCGPAGCGAALTPYAQSGWRRYGVPTVDWFSVEHNRLVLLLFAGCCVLALILLAVSKVTDVQYPEFVQWGAGLAIAGPVIAVVRSVDNYRVLTGTSIFVTLLVFAVLGLVVAIGGQVVGFRMDLAAEREEEERQARVERYNDSVLNGT